MPISFVVAIVFVFFNHFATQWVAIVLPLAFMSSVAIEVLKHEAKSGWSKFVLTLPVKRERVVQSHYLFFLLVSGVGLVILGIQFMISNGLGMTLGPGYIYNVMNAVGIVFTLGFVTYPLTYMLGTEKAEAILMIGVGAGIGLYFLSALLYNLMFSGWQGNSDLLFSLSFMLMTLILFIISYIVSIQVYKRKEF